MEKLVLLAGFLVMFLVSNHSVMSECCQSYTCDEQVTWDPAKCYCLDGTVATPYCAYGRCNIFGCNCDGGCRTGSGKRTSLVSGTSLTKTEEQRISTYSRTHVNQLALTEAYELVKSPRDGARYNGTLADFTTIFKSADKDGNGNLNIQEINELKA